MKLLPKDRQLYVSGRIWHEILPKVDVSPFIYALHEGIDLCRYGSGLKRFYFSFIIMPPGEQINLPYARYDHSKRTADIAVAIPYEEAGSASPNEMIQLMETAYLQGIKKLAALDIPDFDHSGFRQAVEKLFAKEGWYREALAE